jgi:hypothetical protein
LETSENHGKPLKTSETPENHEKTRVEWRNFEKPLETSKKPPRNL